MMDGWQSGLVTGGVALVGNLIALAGWAGYHKRRHEDIDKSLTHIVEEVKHVTDQCAECEVDILHERQESMRNQLVGMDHKLNELIERTGRIERLEAKMSASEQDRQAMNRKLDDLIRTVGELRGHIMGRGAKFE